MKKALRKNILLVEDTRVNAEIFASVLRKNGYTVKIARNGEEAISAVKNDPDIDLVLMDIELDGSMDGIQAAESIQQIKELPVVFLSSHTEKGIVERVKAVTRYGYVVKNSGEFVLLSTLEMAFELFESHQKVRESEQRFRNMFLNHGAVMLLIEPENGRIVDANQAACRFYGYPKETLLHMQMNDLCLLSPEEDYQLRERARCNENNYFVLSHQLAGGEVRTVEVYSSPIQVNEQTLLFQVIFDITERKRAHEQAKLFQRIFEDSLSEIYVFHTENFKYLAVNRGARENLGFSVEELQEMTPFDVKPELTYERFQQIIAPLLKGKQEKVVFNTVHRRKDSSLYPVEIHLQILTHNEENVFFELSLDLTERKKMEEKLILLSITDPLTQAFNRRYFMQVLEKEIERLTRDINSAPFSLIMFDLDHFKRVNDDYGHEAGDRVLKEVVQTVQKRIRKVDCLARWGGEEFILLIIGSKIEAAVALAEILRERIQNLVFEDIGQVTASFGVTTYRRLDTIDSLIQRVDQLLYEAKRSGRNCVFHD